MKAEAALREPGDVARRESDGAVAVCIRVGFAGWINCGDVGRQGITAFTGDDWQPLHPAADHAAEVKRLTAELAKAEEKSEARRKLSNARQDMVDCLTARVAELENGIREWITDADAVFESPGQMRAEWQKSYRRFKAALSPLPTAGDEGESWAWSKEDIERRKKVAAWVEATDPAPAEPDSPAEEREGVTLTPGEAATVRDFIGAHSSAVMDRLPLPQTALEAALDVFTRLCDEIGDPPKHTCEPRDGSGFSIGDKVYVVESRTIWEVHAKQKDGTYLLLAPGINCFESPRKMLHAVRAIHHDPTDAAAVELRGRIAEGGGE